VGDFVRMSGLPLDKETMLKSGGGTGNKLIFQTGQKITQSGQGSILSLMCKMLELINKMEFCLQKRTPQGIRENRVSL